MTSRSERVLIIGGGVGGSAVCLALRRAGFEAVVFERAPELQHIQVGGSYVLWYGGVLSLSHLGLADQVHRLGHPVERFEMCDAHGRLFGGYDAGGRARTLGALPVAVPRADLLSVLTGALDEGALRLGATFREMVQDGSGVTATFTDGHEERGAVLVGADGLDSTVRAHLHGFAPPRHPGYAHWSGLAEDDGGAPAGVFRVLHGKGARFGFFHLGGRVCWWCVRNAPPGPPGDVLGGYQALTTFFGDWAAPTRALLEATPPESIHRRDTLDRPRLRRWGEGRVTLLGDAAHAMTFNLGQGAGTSLTDAVVLAEHLARAPVLAALRGYEDARRSTTTLLVRMSRVVGAVASWDWPLGPKLNELFIRSVPSGTPRLLERDARGHPALVRS